jgi:hypothetical protein
MADLSESDYGEEYYGRGFYSYLPIWLFGSDVSIPFSVDAALTSYAFRTFEANVTIPFFTSATLGITYTFDSYSYIPVFVYSDEYIGPFWIGWRPDVPGEGPWVPDVPIVEPWVPDVPVSVEWIAVSGTGNWTPHIHTYGPWIPIGPDMRPNDG